MSSHEINPEVHPSENLDPSPAGNRILGPPKVVDLVKKSLQVFHPSGSCFEIRILQGRDLHVNGSQDLGTRTYFGYFDDPKIAANAVAAAVSGSASYGGIYFTLNPVGPGRDAKVKNAIRAAKKGSATGDADIQRRIWLLIDFDPIRSPGISSSSAEHDAALSRAHSVSASLLSEGWPEPVVCDSGNGGHLDYAINLPADDAGLVQRVLEKLAERFDTPMVKIDQTVYNPARICKLYGTLACKGENTSERPHRLSAILSVPAQLIPIDRDFLEAFAGGEVPLPPFGDLFFDIDAWLLKQNVPVGPPEPWGTKGRRWPVSVCPFNPAHDRGEAVLLQLPSGAVSFKCHHDSCRGNKWREFRALYESPVAPPNATGAASSSPPFPLTDSGNADRLEDAYQGQIRYCVERGRWLIWDSRRWVPDDTGRIYALALERMRLIPSSEISSAMTPAELKAIHKWAKASESKNKLEAMISLGQKRQDLVIRAGDLDANDWTLNVANGLIDLRTGSLLPHNPTDYCSKLVDTPYDPNAAAPLWERFLSEILSGNQDLISFLQRAIGYCLSGSIQEQCFFILHGIGANGKSTFLTTLRMLLGDYAAQMAPSTLQVRRDSNARGDIARLDGARLVLSSETGRDTRLDEPLVKQMTGGDPLVARYLYHEDFEFIPKFKIFVATNKRPEIHGQEEGIWRRVHLIPFDVTIPETRRDPQLLAKLTLEFPGILAWAMRGCLDFLANGLQPPTRVQEATAAYRTESDVLGGFLESCCVLAAGHRVSVKDLYESYRRYCEANSEEPLAKGTLSKILRDRGITPDRKGAVRYHIGIALVATVMPLDDSFAPEYAESIESSIDSDDPSPPLRLDAESTSGRLARLVS